MLQSIKNMNAQRYLKLLANSQKKLICAIGPAGTGKTMIATQQAIHEFKQKRVNKIVITRPVVGADEDLGFLPGKLEDKMAPWMRPIFDIFWEHYRPMQVEKMMKNNQLEIAPLAYMRGRTFKNSFIIGDELQNTTYNQMKMLLTRIGEGSRMVITGDIQQTDLEGKSGLEYFMEMLMIAPELDNIGYVLMNKEDVKRSEIVQKILDLYEISDQTYV